MAVALDVGWISSELGSSFARMSKKRTWGEDHQKQLEMMLGKPFDETESDHTDTVRSHTLNLLGGSSTSDSIEQQQQQAEFLELGADAPLPNGWEKRLDLKSGMVYFTNVNTGKSTYDDPRNQHQQQQQQQQLQKSRVVTSPSRSLELLHPPSPPNLRGSCHISLELLQSEMCKQQQQQVKQVLELEKHEKLESSSSSSSNRMTMMISSSSSSFDAKKKPQVDLNKFDVAEATRLDLELNLAAAAQAKLEPARPVSPPSPPRCSSSECPKWLLAAMPPQPPPQSPKVTLIGCKRCLMYVMISRDDPKCPKCGSSMVVDFPIAKRPRFDLEL